MHDPCLHPHCESLPVVRLTVYGQDVGGLCQLHAERRRITVSWSDPERIELVDRSINSVIEGPDDEVAVYRLWDEHDDLLYIGKSRQPVHRIRQHIVQQPWGAQIARRRIDWYPSDSDAMVAELEAIRTHHPRHNKQGRVA